MMTNKVVHILAKAFNDFGITAVRFNYRGVGGSAGRYDEGAGETDDALAVMDWAVRRWPGVRLWLGGFSFGGGVAIRAASARRIEGLVTVAPAIREAGVPAGDALRMPWLLIQGDQDELVDARDVQEWAAGLPFPPQIALLPGVGHFFHGRLAELRSVVLDWLKAGLDSSPPEAAG
ncbi:alpha/beta hydrolase [Steroidobacter denitrificans]|nr:alpha/beta fold hydrolase [Steroidobacter denitrificans]